MKGLFTALFSLLLGSYALAQCTSNVPNFIVNLSADPNGIYISPDTNRAGLCCGASGSVRCISFELTLHPDAEGVLFEIFSGAVPGGALFYQINCGPQQNVGTPICLSGTGPHNITFCKPGGNFNRYRIRSIAEPTAPDSLYVNDGCTGLIGTDGFEPSSIVYNSVFPGPKGLYNNYMSCLFGCDTTYINALPGYPAFIEVEVCGYPFGGCDTLYTCDTVKVNFFSTLAVQINPLQPTVCFGSLGTTITAVPQGGSPPYTYNWSTLETTQSIFVDTGTYIIELGDTSGCPPTYDTVVVTSFNSTIDADAGPDIQACRDAGQYAITGIIQAAAGGHWTGEGGTFLPSPDSLNIIYIPTPIELMGAQSTLKLVTTGNGSCPADSDEVIIFYNDFDGFIDPGAVPVSCVGDSDGIGFIEVFGVSSPYLIEWGPATGNQVGDSALNLAAGIYNITVTDSLGCKIDTNVEVIEADSALNIDLQITPVTCFGDSNGAVNLTITGGFPPYQIMWDPVLSAGNVSSINGLKAGFYSLTVLDSTNCQIDTIFEVVGPVGPLTLAFNIVNVSCLGGDDGAITAIPSGGLAPYFYNWNAAANSQTTQTASGLVVGTYAVTVSDSLGCIIEDSASVIQPVSPITYTDTTTSPSCTGFNDGTATVFPSGGTPPYTFLWDSLAGNQTTQTATGLTAGTYHVTIFDQNSCLYSQAIIVTDPPLLFLLNAVVTDVKCFGDSTGSAIITPVGGVPPYTFTWTTNAGSSTDSIVTGLPAGTYGVTVFDQNNCIVLPGVEIKEPSDSISTIMTSNITSCKGSNDGTATVTASGGTPPYTYLWDNNALNQTTDTAFNLTSGTYSVTVTDSLGCVRDDNVFVPEPDSALIVTTFSNHVNCFGDSGAFAAIQVSGGFQPYTIQWDANTNLQTGDTAFNLPFGTYTVNILDSVGCEIDTFVDVNQPSGPLTADIDFRAVACFKGNDGKSWVTPTGGTPPYQFLWDVAAGSQTTDTAFNLTAGTYSVTVTDTNGCSFDTSITVIQPSFPLTLFSNSKPVSCNNAQDGRASIQVIGGFTPYSYQWGFNAGSQTTDTAFNLSGGTYMITVTDSLGCADNLAVTVIEPDTIGLNFIPTNLKCHNDASGSATVNVIGGSAPFQAKWVSNTHTKIGLSPSGLNAETYVVTITDRSQCKGVDSLTLTEPTPVVITVSGNDTICPGASVTLTVSATGGSGQYNYIWNAPLVGNVTTQTVSPSKNSLYIVSAEDSIGCKSNFEVFNIYVNDFAGDSVNLIGPTEICIGDTAQLLAIHNSRFKNYQYKWTNNGKFISANQGPINVIPESTTTYLFEVINECNLSFFDSITVIVNPAPEINLPNLWVDGCSPLTVKFVQDVGMDSNLLKYMWEFGDGTKSTSISPTHTFTEPGNYNITLNVTTNKGCESNGGVDSYVTVRPLPTIEIGANPNRTNLQQPTIAFAANNSGNWNFGDDSSATGQFPFHTYSDTGTYRVLYVTTSEFGCIDSSTLTVIIDPYFLIEIPNAFSPNPGEQNGGKYGDNDMDNNVFHPHTEGVEEYQMLIYNRWGELIFESKDLAKGWDGYYKGELCQQEVYVWKLNIVYENGQTYKGVGDVTLYR